MKRRPNPDEYPPFYAGYIALATETDICSAMAAQADETQRFLASIDPGRASYRYAPDKWSIKEVVGHLGDGERIFGYRAACFSRGESQPLPGFDEGEYVRRANFDRCSLVELADELSSLRRANILMFRRLEPATWDNSGIANEKPISIRAIAYSLVGHERHHLRVLRERYGV